APVRAARRLGAGGVRARARDRVPDRPPARRRHHRAEQRRPGHAVRREAPARLRARAGMSQPGRPATAPVLVAAALATLVLATFGDALPPSRVLYARDIHS